MRFEDDNSDQGKFNAVNEYAGQYIVPWLITLGVLWLVFRIVDGFFALIR